MTTQTGRLAFRLTTGEIIPAEKDCACVTHDGPHWLHIDALDRRRNRELLSARGSRGFAVEELTRLKEKRRNMERAGIAEIVEVLDPPKQAVETACSSGKSGNETTFPSRESPGAVSAGDRLSALRA